MVIDLNFRIFFYKLNTLVSTTISRLRALVQSIYTQQHVHRVKLERQSECESEFTKS